MPIQGIRSRISEGPLKQALSETKRKRQMKLRRKAPSLIQLGNSEQLQNRFVKPRSSQKHKPETIEACSEIHGAIESDERPCLDGMWVSLVSNTRSEQLKNYIAWSKKTRKVLPSVVNKAVAEFEKSTDNSVRSVKVLYCKGLISKEKFKSVIQSLSMKSNGSSIHRSSIKVSRVRVPKISEQICSMVSAELHVKPHWTVYSYICIFRSNIMRQNIQFYSLLNTTYNVKKLYY